MPDLSPAPGMDTRRATARDIVKGLARDRDKAGTPTINYRKRVAGKFESGRGKKWASGPLPMYLDFRNRKVVTVREWAIPALLRSRTFH